MKITKSYLKQVIKEELEEMKGTAGEDEKGTAGEDENQLLQRLKAVDQEYMRTPNADTAFEFRNIMKQLSDRGVDPRKIKAALK